MKQTKIEMIFQRVVLAMEMLETMQQNAAVTAVFAQLMEAKRIMDEIERAD